MSEAALSETSPEIIPFSDSDSVSIAEQIGRPARRVSFRANRLWRSFEDVNVSDYAFWDKARRGQAAGLELSGLLIKPLGSKITSWVLGRLPLWSVKNQKISGDLNTWWRKNHPNFMRAYNESLDLGDCYIVFNGDASVTVVSPDRVYPVVDPDDLKTWIGWKIIVTVPDPNQVGTTMTYEDTYTAKSRTSRIYKDGAKVGADVIYPNPLGRIPVVHISNRKGSDERFGRPEAEGALNAMLRYGDVFDAALNGNIRQGRPTPVISKMGSSEQVNKFWEKFGVKETFINAKGEQEEAWVIPFDPDQLLTLGGDATFSYEAPGSFSADTQNLLGLLFYLFLQHTEIPEFIWGGAIGSSKASADSQLDPFIKFIDKKRGEAMNWISELAELWVAWTAAFNIRARSLTPQALWRPMASGDGRLTLDTVIWAWSKNLMDDEMAVWMLPLNLDNPDEIVADGMKAADARQQAAATKPVPPDQVPASGGGTQGNFGRLENPVLPTQRQMAEPDLSDEQITEFAAMLKKMMLKQSETFLYEQEPEAIIEHNRSNGNAELEKLA